MFLFTMPANYKMKKTKKNIEIDSYKFIIIVLLIIIIFLCTITYCNYKIKDIEIDYYKDQMNSFCELSEFYQGDIYPHMYPCEKWLLSGEELK